MPQNTTSCVPTTTNSTLIRMCIAASLALQANIAPGSPCRDSSLAGLPNGLVLPQTYCDGLAAMCDGIFPNPMCPFNTFGLKTFANAYTCGVQASPGYTAGPKMMSTMSNLGVELYCHNVGACRVPLLAGNQTSGYTFPSGYTLDASFADRCYCYLSAGQGPACANAGVAFSDLQPPPAAMATCTTSQSDASIRQCLGLSLAGSVNYALCKDANLNLLPPFINLPAPLCVQAAAICDTVFANTSCPFNSVYGIQNGIIGCTGTSLPMGYTAGPIVTVAPFVVDAVCMSLGHCIAGPVASPSMGAGGAATPANTSGPATPAPATPVTKVSPVTPVTAAVTKSSPPASNLQNL